MLTKNYKEVIPIGQHKWQDIVIESNNIEWYKIYQIATKCKLNAKLQFFNYQILHRTLITKENLKLFHLADSDECNKDTSIERSDT